MVQNLLLSGVCKGSLAISLNNDDIVDGMLLPHRLLPLHLFIAPHQLLLLLQLGFLFLDLPHRHQVLLVLQRSFYLKLQFDSLDPFLFPHSLDALFHEQVIGLQGVREELIVLVGHPTAWDFLLEQYR
jgi:hypothetical protein